MAVLDGLKYKLGLKMIQKELNANKRKSKVFNYAQAKSIGIIYPIKDKDFQFFVTKYVDYLRKEVGFKTIQTIGFYDSKEEPVFLDLGSKFQFFNKKDLTFSLKPKSQEVETFIQTPFDILIDLSENYVVPLKYIQAKSVASFKVGRYNEAFEKHYDFMVNLPQNASVKEYIDQVNYYLNYINNHG